MTPPPYLTVVIPAYDEAQSIGPLIDRLFSVLPELGSFEIIFINDGSTDGTEAILDQVQAGHPETVKVIHQRTNYGKAVALQTGFNHARGEIIVMMDGDLQDQPEEIPKMLALMKRNQLDMVNGWKINRQDPYSKTMPSGYFNKVMSALSGLVIHDFNCGLKAFKRECLTSFHLYGQMHRFIVYFIARRGFKVGEMEVAHAPRAYGRSKYGFKRNYHGLMDLLTVFFISRYMETPLYFFGFYGVASIALAVIIGTFFISMHFLSFGIVTPRWHLSEHPLWITAPILFLLGLIMIFFGLLGELITYYWTANRDLTPLTARKVGFGPQNCADNHHS